MLLVYMLNSVFVFVFVFASAQILPVSLHSLCLPRVNCPRPFRQNACEPSIPLVCTYTECIWQFQLCVFGNHYGTTILAKHFKLFEQKLIMQLFNLFIVLLMFFCKFSSKNYKKSQFGDQMYDRTFYSKSNE